jgi:phosphopantothenoylcysteine decarboxylase/phosphopantothenate--cysteine ligase
MKKEAGVDSMTLRMAKNPDIIAGVDGASILKIGFAAETESLIENARRKVNAKGLQMIVANDAVRTIGSDDVAATLLFADGREARSLGPLSKEAFARELIAEVVELRRGQPA